MKQQVSFYLCDSFMLFIVYIGRNIVEIQILYLLIVLQYLLSYYTYYQALQQSALYLYICIHIQRQYTSMLYSTSSSLSSFSNNSVQDSRNLHSTLQYQHKNKQQLYNKIGQYKTRNESYCNDQFSQFEDQPKTYTIINYERKQNIHAHKNTQIIAKLQRQIVQLKQENSYLRDVTLKMAQQIDKYKHNTKQQQMQQSLKDKTDKLTNNIITKTKQTNNSKQQQVHKMQNIAKQISKLKQNMTRLKAESQQDKQTIQQMKRKLEQYRQQTEWKDRFIGLFIDMVDKISHDIDIQWSNKKKIQIGWKIVKIIIDKALHSGVKVPKVQRRSICKQ